MLSFENDYSEGAHEKILQRFMETNLEKVSGYGSDPYCESAKQKIREACECPQADVYFLTLIKQRGALLAKGRLLGIQFDTLFTDNLYFEISRHAIAMADYLKKGMAEKGCRFYLDSPTNQQFVILENRKMTELKKEVKFSFWEKYDENHTVVRFATSWATKKEEIDQLLDLF